MALAAAEAAGGAAWCVDTAAAYAAERRQFGRPIGQFQGVKHRCADMLVSARADQGAWRGTRRSALDTAPEEVALATAMAGAIALDAFVEVAKDCIQVLGGIGFTWEHDAHLYLRRAVSLRQLFGGGTRWRQATATAALAGQPARAARRPAARGRAAARRGPGDGAAAEGDRPAASGAGAMAEAGWVVPHWPRAVGARRQARSSSS